MKAVDHRLLGVRDGSRKQSLQRCAGKEEAPTAIVLDGFRSAESSRNWSIINVKTGTFS